MHGLAIGPQKIFQAGSINQCFRWVGQSLLLHGTNHRAWWRTRCLVHDWLGVGK